MLVRSIPAIALLLSAGLAAAQTGTTGPTGTTGSTRTPGPGYSAPGATAPQPGAPTYTAPGIAPGQVQSYPPSGSYGEPPAAQPLQPMTGTSGGAATITGGAPLSSIDRYTAQKQAEGIAVAALQQKGFQVLRVMGEPKASDLAGEDDSPDGFIVWADTAQCPNGKVVVSVDTTGAIQQIYTRYNCPVEIR